MSLNKKPSFFIIGAPKCGTTSLADWLRDHNHIFMSDPKEPHFFNTDSNHHSVFSLNQYQSLFDSVTEKHKAVGEASVWYLVSETAVENILAVNSSAKFIVCLRNPIEAAVSLHDQKVFSGDETITNFEAAWVAQEKRKNGDLPFPPTCLDERHYLYGDSCLFGKLLERVYQQVDKENVLVLLMDDMKAHPEKVYRQVLKHIDVEDDGRSDFTPSNPAKQRKWMWVRRYLRRVMLIKNKFGFTQGTGIGALINRWNTVERPRKPLSDKLSKELNDYFSDDIDLLQQLLNRDLQHWKKY
ncbi:sulfotransferase domain-containing protein [Pseudomonadales bacterium]|nr:sulfotransferase domain-containing protein [Pseudomonadales bacterium]